MSEHPPLAIYVLERAPMGTPQFCAFFVGSDGFLPVRFLAQTEQSIRDQAAAFWEKHAAKYEKAPGEVPAYRLAALEKARAARIAKSKAVAA